MKKSVEILGLPVISITEGRELGMSKYLLIDAKNGSIAAITIEDEDWYRGVKLLPYSSVIAIGNDAVTVTNSENILTLEDAGDYEAMLDANIKIIGTKAITKSGTIQGKVVEIYVGDTGKIEKCEIEASDGSLSEIIAEQISIFGKQVTVIDSDLEKKTELAAPEPVKAVAAPEPAPEPQPVPEPEPEVEILGVEVVHTDNGDMTLGGMTVNGEEYVLVDVDGGDFDVAWHDDNQDQQVQTSELIDISGDHISVNDFAQAATHQNDVYTTDPNENLIAENNMDPMNPGEIDYMDTSDTSGLV